MKWKSNSSISEAFYRLTERSEHRVQPDLLIAQTGFMQGAAGIGTWLLHSSESKRDAAERITFPDSPW